MMEPAVYLGGELAGHARGRTLKATWAAEQTASPPAFGTLIGFAKEYQSDPVQSAAWLAWCNEPGRLLILVPPFARGTCQVPVEWEARRVEPLAGGETGLGRVLARERQHELRGQLFPLERTAGQVVTAGWRKHPAAGLFAVTASPLWSLSTLDHRGLCESWLRDLHAQAGKPLQTKADRPAADQSALRELDKNEWAVLLHVCSEDFSSMGDALEALARSPIYRIAPESARQAMQQLTDMGLVEEGRPTALGDQLLGTGPYGTFARVLRRQHG